MMYSNERIEKAKTAKSAEELLAMAKAENIDMTAEEAAKAFAELHKTGELSDDELDNVSGGLCEDEQVFYIGDRVYHIGADGEKIYGTVERVEFRMESYYAYYVRDDGKNYISGYGVNALTKVN